MNIGRGVKIFSFMFAVFVLLIVLAPSASAKVTALVTKDSAFYEYPYEELLRSYVLHCLGSAASLFDEYMKNDVALLLDDVNGYVDYAAALEMYVKCMLNGKSFDLDAYTSGPDAKLVDVTRVKVVTYENGQLIFTDKEIASPIEVALYDINNAKDAFALLIS